MDAGFPPSHQEHSPPSRFASHLIARKQHPSEVYEVELTFGLKICYGKQKMPGWVRPPESLASMGEGEKSYRAGK